MTFGENMKRIRKQKGLSQRALGEKLGVRQQTIAQYEKAKNTPKLETIRKIANALDVYLYELLDGNWSEISTGEYQADWEIKTYAEEERKIVYQSRENKKNETNTIAAHKEDENFTPEELKKIEEYKKLLLAARPKK